MTHIHRHICSGLIGASLLLSAACVTHVTEPPPVEVVLPPKVDLRLYEKIGMIELASNAEGVLKQFATQKLIQTIQSAQPGVRILELGDEKRVLSAVGRQELDFEAVQAIGAKYGVNGVLVGHLEVTDVKPRIELYRLLTSMSAQADVEASLSAKLLEAESGATLWTSSAKSAEVVAHVRVVAHGPAHFGASDPESAYGRLVQTLVETITEDFWPRYELR